MTSTGMSFNGVSSDSSAVYDQRLCSSLLSKSAMSHSVKSLDEENLIDSWVDLNISGEISRGSDGSQKRLTPISSYINSGKLEKLLWEAQRESCHSSLVGSGISSHKGSPKSPRTPLTDEPPLDGMIPCQFDVVGQRRHGSTDWIWEWSSKPDQRPPKEWKLHHPKPTLSLRNSKAAKSGLFSTEMLTILIVSNLISVLIGTGIGIYISKRVGPEFFHWSKY